MLVFLQKSVIPPLNNFPGLTTIKTLGYLVSRKRQDICSKVTDTVIFRVYENKNANPEEELVFCYQNCSDLL